MLLSILLLLLLVVMLFYVNQRSVVTGKGNYLKTQPLMCDEPLNGIPLPRWKIKLLKERLSQSDAVLIKKDRTR